ncbi:amidohydrolase family protein [Tardiphaga robiniae]|uniref:Amidohydrolase n=1 Tax=Tardiphaga robiniae TaxID=943830 RepID=A0A163X6C4_9BRAD|nr:amidohydrolase family protein [Tardiphaga robiniae]KZD20475.1 amidohydrolase [Tardiphaga robiniae]
MDSQVAATHLLVGDGRGLVTNAILKHEAGTISAIDTAPAGHASAHSLVMPAFVNAHDHARLAGAAIGSCDLPLETVLPRSGFGAPPDPYLGAAAALARSARAGCGAMMVHYTRPSGTMSLIDEAKEIARAARDVGIRMAFAFAVRDKNPIVYGDSEGVLSALKPADRQTIESLFVRRTMQPRDYIELTETVSAEIASPLIDVQFGPAGVQWCSRPMLEAIAERSATTGRQVHMHLLETPYQRKWADQEFPGGIVHYLRDIGLLSERLTVAHCIYAHPGELELLAQSGVRIVTNFGSNLHTYTGLGPIAAAHKCGCGIAVGVDGRAVDEDGDIIREMRIVQMIHGGTGFDRTWSREEFLSLTIKNGRRAVGAPGVGVLTPGSPADFVTLDMERLERDVLIPSDPIQLLFARGNTSFVKDVTVAGQTIVSDGILTGIDLPAVEQEFREKYRAANAGYSQHWTSWGPFEKAVREWYKGHVSCE